MLGLVIENLRPSCPHRFTFICQSEHLKAQGLDRVIASAAPGAHLNPIESVTEGAVCTVLLAESIIDTDEPLMIANCDQYVSTAIDDYLGAMAAGNWDGFIMTMTADDPKWSFIHMDGRGAIVEVVEKQVVSNEATVGIYNYRKGRDFVRAAKAMISANDRVKGEFYVAPAYNYMIREGARLGYYNVGSERTGMYGLGIPEDLEYFNALEKLPGT